MNRIKLIDWLSGKHAWRFYREYAASQWYSRRELEELQLARLKRLLEHCWRHVPFYREILEERGIRVEKVMSLDVLKSFPVIDKSVVKEHYNKFVSESRAGLQPVRRAQTGGTTGEPLRFAKDAGVRSSTEAAMFRFNDWMKVALEDPKIVVWGAPIVDRGLKRRARDLILRRLTNTVQLDAFSVNKSARERLHRVFKAQRPVLLHGYCQSIYELACWMDEWGCRFPLRAVSTTVEPLFDEYRSMFRHVFGCETFDQYGCGEVEAIAMECDHHAGLHVCEERVILETDREGRVIVTDLENLGFPFIRYANGDRAELSDRPCECRRQSMVLRRILGRTGDVIGGVNGNRVHPEFFTHLLNETNIALKSRLKKYQVVQEAKDRLLWRLVADPLSEEDQRWLVQEVRRHLGDMSVVIVQVRDIAASQSGKFRYVVGLDAPR